MFYRIFIKRHYGQGIFIVTLLVVFHMEALGQVGPEFIFERLGCCTLGSLPAFVGVWWGMGSKDMRSKHIKSRNPSRA